MHIIVKPLSFALRSKTNYEKFNEYVKIRDSQITYKFMELHEMLISLDGEILSSKSICFVLILF